MSDLTLGRITQLTHTPGPWHVEHQSTPSQHHATGGEPVLGIYAGGAKIAALATADRADATLLAAGPEMLAALESTLDYWESIGFAECDPGCDCIVEMVRAAIAKAKGGAK